MRYFILIALAVSTASCFNTKTTNIADNSLSFYNIQSDYRLTDINHYGCGAISQADLEHVLLTGIKITATEQQAHYSSTGCSIKGSLKFKHQPVPFRFDYGGLFYIGNNLILGCAEVCCANEFEFCTFEASSQK